MTAETIQKMEAVQSWCESLKTPEIITVANAQSEDFVTSSGLLIGGDAHVAYDQDNSLKAATTTAEFLEAFKKAPVNGCMSVMTMALNASGFDPLKQEDKNAHAKFDNYRSRLQGAPFFFLSMADRSVITRRESNWDEAIQRIVNLYEGISLEDHKKILESLGQMVDALKSVTQQKESKDLFVQSTINYDKEIKVYIYWSTVTMEKNKSGKTTSEESTVDISKLILRFDKEMWPYYAETIMQYLTTSIDDWTKMNTSPYSKKGLKEICFLKGKV